jgi:hypothetical protein
MKRFLILIALCLLSVFSIYAESFHEPRGFAGKAMSSTFALYATLGPITHFDCTIEPIAKIEGGYRLLTAGHCVQEVPDHMQFSVANEIGGTLYPVTLVKAVDDGNLDFALFDLKTTKKYFVFDLGLTDTVTVGDHTINPNFALGLGKQLSYGIISSRQLIASEDCDADDDCVGAFLVQAYGGPGASGSAVLSAKTHRIIGLAVVQPRGSVGLGVEPIAKYAQFLLAPNQPHPAAAGSIL